MADVSAHGVARKAGEELGTVSRVLNGAPMVGAETRQRVQDAIDKLGYRPSTQWARATRSAECSPRTSPSPARHPRGVPRPQRS